MAEKRNSYLVSKALKSFMFASILAALAQQVATTTDAIVVSHLIGPDAMSAVNLVMPVLSLCTCIGYLFGMGGSVVAAKAMGRRDLLTANRVFTASIAATLFIGILLSLAGFAFAETPQEVNYNGNPIVVVGGYGGAQLKLTENGEVIWYMDTDAIVRDLLQNLIRIVPDLALMKAHHPEFIAKTLRPYLEKYLGKFKTDENGESVYDISPTLEPTAESAHSTQIEHSADMDLLTHLEGIVPLEQCYFLGFDLRCHAIDNANRLKQLIDSVLETTGAEKVDLMRGAACAGAGRRNARV